VTTEKTKITGIAIAALTAISLITIVGGIAISVFRDGTPVEGVGAIVTGAVGGIVAIVLREKNESPPEK